MVHVMLVNKSIQHGTVLDTNSSSLFMQLVRYAPRNMGIRECWRVWSSNTCESLTLRCFHLLYFVPNKVCYGILLYFFQQEIWILYKYAYDNHRNKLELFLKNLDKKKRVGICRTCARAKVRFLLLDPLLQQEEAELGGLTGGNGQLWTLGIGLLATALAATYVTRLAKVTPTSSKLSSGRVLCHTIWQLKIQSQHFSNTIKLQIRH